MKIPVKLIGYSRNTQWQDAVYHTELICRPIVGDEIEIGSSEYKVERIIIKPDHIQCHVKAYDEIQGFAGWTIVPRKGEGE